jgi:hypothetical protein
MGTPESSVWIFLSDRGHWPSGVFSSREVAVRWIAGHRLTGMITEYPVDVGVYDWALASGSFRPRKPQHSSAEFIGGSTTAVQEHEHFTDGICDWALQLQSCRRQLSRRAPGALPEQVSVSAVAGVRLDRVGIACRPVPVSRCGTLDTFDAGLGRRYQALFSITGQGGAPRQPPWKCAKIAT